MKHARVIGDAARRSAALLLSMAAVVTVTLVPQFTMAFGPHADTGPWQKCDAYIRLFEPNIIRQRQAYETAMNNCLLAPDTSLQCIQLCLVGKVTTVDSSCVQVRTLQLVCCVVCTETANTGAVEGHGK